MALEAKFWLKRSLEEMSPEEWEALCDGCAKCCLFKLRESDDDPVRFTNVVCRYMDMESCRCTDYVHRHINVPECIYLNPRTAREADWLPSSCAYRLVAQGLDLPWWHPLQSGSAESVRVAGASVYGKVVSEDEINPDDLEDMVVNWFD